MNTLQNTQNQTTAEETEIYELLEGSYIWELESNYYYYKGWEYELSEHHPNSPNGLSTREEIKDYSKVEYELVTLRFDSDSLLDENGINSKDYYILNMTNVEFKN